jgi:toxin-antitoxin system PIN domain toxin
MIVDANVLLYAVDRASPFHERSQRWLEEWINGATRVGLPWQSLGAFVRIVTHARALERPRTAAEAWDHVRAWLAQPSVWVPVETERHATVLEDLVLRHDVRGNLISDAPLTALAIEHARPVASADADFARFPEVTWVNPLTSWRAALPQEQAAGVVVGLVGELVAEPFE